MDEISRELGELTQAIQGLKESNREDHDCIFGKLNSFDVLLRGNSQTPGMNHRLRVVEAFVRTRTRWKWTIVTATAIAVIGALIAIVFNVDKLLAAKGIP